MTRAVATNVRARRAESTSCRIGWLSAWLLLVVAPSPATAQQTVSDVLGLLMTNDAVQTGSIERDRAAAQATSETISRALLANLSTLPVTSSSAAFVYRLNPALGTVTRTTGSFGPFFIERAATAGAGSVSIGFSVQQMHFTSLDGNSLRNGTLETTANQFPDEPVPFDVDRLKLGIDASVATLYANVGITNRLEVGAAVPYVWLRLDGTRVNTYRGRTFTQASASADAFGVADMIVRAKYWISGTGGHGVAAAVDLRLPTGRKADLLGTGSTSARLTAIGSFGRGPWSIHVNGGVGTGGLAREVTYGGAVESAVGERVTVSGEILGRWLDVPGNIVTATAPNPTIPGANTIRLVPGQSTLTMVTAAPGVKVNVGGTWLLIANVLIPLGDAGLTAPATPFVGLDYAFGR